MWVWMWVCGYGCGYEWIWIWIWVWMYDGVISNLLHVYTTCACFRKHLPISFLSLFFFVCV